MAITVPTAGIARRVLEHVRTPLHRDAYALAASSALTAATGLVYWIVAAHVYSPRAVGLNSVLISSMMFLAGIASLNLPNLVVRFLPEAGRRTRPMLLACYAAAVVVGLVATTVFLLSVEGFAPRLAFLRDSPALWLWFGVST